jgi:hypothetical protein
MCVGGQFGLSYDALSRIAKAMIGAYLPVPTIGLNYWINPLCLDRRLLPLNVFPGLAVLGDVVFVLAGLRRSPTALFVFVAGVETVGLLDRLRQSTTDQNHGSGNHRCGPCPFPPIRPAPLARSEPRAG